MRPKLEAWSVLVVTSLLAIGACTGGFKLPIEPDDAGDDGATHDANRYDARPPTIEASDVAIEANDPDGIDASDPRCTACDAYGSAMELGAIPSQVRELSGLAASTLHPGILYAHNDSGDAARFFALSEAASLRAELDLVNAVATDWEDIAVAPCPAGSCIYIGDIGDNDLKRTQYAIYRVAEPDQLPTDGSSVPVTYERFPFVYPDGAHNSETLLVHRATGRIFVVTKVQNVQGAVYELPLPLKAGEVATLTKLMDVSLPALAGVITGGSFHPCSNRLLLRTYFALYELSDLLDSRPEALFAAPPMQVPVATEVQGEAVTYAEGGRGYFTASETVAGAPASQLNVVSCP